MIEHYFKGSEIQTIKHIIIGNESNWFIIRGEDHIEAWDGIIRRKNC